jgi:hypothetical protein
MPVLRLALLLLTVLAHAACGADRSPASPSPGAPSPAPPIVAGARTGPTTIAFVEAAPAPGSTIAGCGPRVAGCVNRVRMQFSLAPSQTGAVLYVAAFLHASNKIACLSARSGPLQLTAGQSRPVELVFDQADNCGVPLTIATMAVVVEGTVEVASRQEWALAYTFSP